MTFLQDDPWVVKLFFTFYKVLLNVCVFTYLFLLLSVLIKMLDKSSAEVCQEQMMFRISVVFLISFYNQRAWNHGRSFFVVQENRDANLAFSHEDIPYYL